MSERFISKDYDGVHSDIFDNEDENGQEIATVYNEDVPDILDLLNGMNQRIRKAESYLKIFNPLVYQAYLESFKED